MARQTIIRKQMTFNLEAKYTEMMNEIVKRERKRTGYHVTKHDILRRLIDDCFEKEGELQKWADRL